MKNKLLFVFIIGLLIFSFGCSDDESTPYDPNMSHIEKTYLRGMAADGDPIKGAVFVKGTKTQRSDDGSIVKSEIVEVKALISSDGKFEANVSDLDPPYVILAKGKGKLDSSVAYYSIASSSNDWSNCTKFSDAAVRMATDNDPEKEFKERIQIPDNYETSKNQIKLVVQSLLPKLPDQPANFEPSKFDPFTAQFVATSDDIFDNLLSMTKITVSSESIGISSNQLNNAVSILSLDYKKNGSFVDISDDLKNLDTNKIKETFDELKTKLLSTIVNLTILQTSDLHNHASGYGPLLDYTPMDTSDHDSVKGGFARLASVIAANKVDLGAKGIPVLLVDSGDYFMGTMYDMAATAPVPFVYFEALGYDVITLGNHEFDWSPSGLYNLLNNAVSHKDMPFTFNVPIVASNTIIPEDNPLYYFTSDGAIDYTHNLIRNKLVKNLPNGLNVGILGWMGKKADEYAPAADPVTFNHEIDSLVSEMDSLIKEDNCHLILILSHGGVDNNGVGDDADLAEAIGNYTKTDIDYKKRVIIASGHEHTATSQPFIKGADETFIFSPGSFGQYLSRFNIRFDLDKKMIVDHSFYLIEINDSIPGYKDIDDAIKMVNTGITENIQKTLETGVDTPVAILKDFEITFSESKAGPSGLGKLCTDATRAVANALAVSSTNTTPYMLSIMATGNIRDTLKPGKTGKITFSDIFNVLPLGLSPRAADPNAVVPPGYPLFSVYLNADDIRKICEFSVAVELGTDTFIKPLLHSEYYLNFSGISYEYNPANPFSTRIEKIAFYNPEDPMCTGSYSLTLSGDQIKDTNNLYRAVVDLYLLQMFGTILSNPTYAALSDYFPIFKDKNGNPLELAQTLSPEHYISFSDNYAIDSDPLSQGIQEIYAWTALLKFMQAWKGNDNFEHENGLPVIPSVCPYNSDFFQRTWKHEAIAELTILQTSDIHNHASGYGPFLDYTPMDTTDSDGITGGMARLAGKIAEIKINRLISNIPMLLVDSGDYFMGTMYDMAASAPVPFIYFEALGYDAITLGNHEFDWGPSGLALLINNGINNTAMPFNVPIVASNTIIPAGNALIPFQQKGLLRENRIIELPNGLMVGILGWMGKQADKYAPAADPVTFDHEVANLQEKVNVLRGEDVGCDIILLLSHGGVEENGEGDDKNLAKAVNGIDIIASGHAHTATHELFEVNNTLIFSPGSFGRYLSRLDIQYDFETKTIVNHNFNLIKIDDSVQGYPDIQNAIDQVDAVISQNISTSLGINVDTPVALLKNFEIKYKESQAGPSGLGNLCTDATRAVANTLAATSLTNTFMLSVMANGNLRDSLKPGKTGKITFSDVFNVLPLGLSPLAGIYTNVTIPPGYPLFSVYLNAADIRKFCEIAVAVEFAEELNLDDKLTAEYYLHFSGIKYEYQVPTDPNQVGKLVNNISFFSPADPMCMTQTIITLPAESIRDNNSTDVYRAVVDLYLLQMVYTIKKDPDYAGFVYLDLVPEFRKANGEPLDISPSVGGNKYLDFSNNYAIDSSTEYPGTQEIYAWAALLKYIQAWSAFFPLEDGLPVLPATVPYNESYLSTFSRVIQQ